MPTTLFPEGPRVKNYTTIAALFGVSRKQLVYIVDGLSDYRKYHQFSIPKRSGGTRPIYSPRDELKRLQHKLLEVLEGFYTPPPCTMGFVKGRSILTNATKHSRKKHVFNFDLEDFFPSIHFGRVYGLFKSLSLCENSRAARILASIACCNKRLPPGAPCSPIIANMICLKLDRDLMKLAQKHNCQYTRYCDDITFSKKAGTFPADIGHIGASGGAIAGQELLNLIHSHGFTINSAKTWLFTNQQHQSVTGLTVNEKPNIPRHYIRLTRSLIHSSKIHGQEAALAQHLSSTYPRIGKKDYPESILAIIEGRLAFIKMVKGSQDSAYKSLQVRFLEVNPYYLSTMIKENNAMNYRDFFIAHAYDEKAIAGPLADALIARGASVWYDDYEIMIGDSITAKMNEGLLNARYGVLILSKEFFSPSRIGTRRELEGFLTREDVTKKRHILPLRYQLKPTEISSTHIMLGGLRSEEITADNIDKIADLLIKKLESDS